MHLTSYDAIEPFLTKDGSEIREWAGPVSAPAVNQSLAEATIPVGGATTEHYHRLTEELYLVTAGRGPPGHDRPGRAGPEGGCAGVAPRPPAHRRAVSRHGGARPAAHRRRGARGHGGRLRGDRSWLSAQAAQHG